MAMCADILREDFVVVNEGGFSIVCAKEGVRSRRWRAWPIVFHHMVGLAHQGACGERPRCFDWLRYSAMLGGA